MCVYKREFELIINKLNQYFHRQVVITKLSVLFVISRRLLLYLHFFQFV